MITTHRNLELKAADPDPAWSLARCLELGSPNRGSVDQRDTYFNIPDPRLTLREQSPGSPHMIAYQRADQPGARVATCRIVPVAYAAALRASLEASLGISATVTKHRRLLLWHGVRIHLDEVDRLGAFIELRAPAKPESDLAREHALIAQLRDTLNITDERLCAFGYATLLAPGYAYGLAAHVNPRPS